MKPLKPKKSIEGVSRAKMFIKKDLDFLVGCPGPDGRWVSQPEGKAPEAILISGNHIHKATFTINKLVKDFPKALPKIVGDVDKWSKSHKSLLEILKASVHDNNPLPKSLIDINPEFGEREKKIHNKILRENSSLSYIINSFSWITYLKLETFNEALQWLDTNASYIDKVYKNLGSLKGLNVIIKLWRLSSKVGEKRVQCIILWLSDHRIYEIAMDQGYQYAYLVDSSLGRKRSGEVPPNPTARFGDDILKWIDWLSMQDNQTVKRSLELFDLVYDIHSIDNWEIWWKSLNSTIDKASVIPRALSRHNPLNIKLNSLREKVKKFGENTPLAVKSKLLFSLLMKWSESEKLKDFKQLCKAFNVLPVEYSNIPIRMAFWVYWDNLIEMHDIPTRKIITNIIDEFSDYIKWHSDFSKAISVWEEVLDSWKPGRDPDRYVYTIDDDIIDEISDKKLVPTVFHLLNELSQNTAFGSFKRYEKKNLVLLVNLVEKEHVLDCLFELRKYDISCEYIPCDMLKLALEIIGQSYEHFGSVMKALLNNDERYNDINKVIKPILSICKTSVYETLLIDAVIGRQLKFLCEIALKAGIFEQFGEKAWDLPLPLHNNTDWIPQYPKELHKELYKLSYADENARVTTNRILSNIFPDSGSLKREMDELIIKIENGEDHQGFLKLRVEKLKSWLEGNQPTPGEQKLKNLSKKLRHAAMIRILDRWNMEMDSKFRTCIVKNLNLKEFPAWLEKNNILEIILAIGDLKPAFQNIAHKILTRRASCTLWDFRDEPGNKGFIEKLESNSNLNIAPWLNDDDKIIKKLSNNEEIIFSIERDPIEVLSMGLHFKTCLSPGGINFFSVFSNIIDINKQVIYGKTRNGSVRARALIALTDEGGIITFHPYCNDSNIDFEKILKEFVHSLAEKMNTIVLPEGNVSKLIAPDWYDDGPYDLSEKFPFALEGSDFRKNLFNMNSVELLSSMKKEAEPIGLNELTIPLFIFLTEIKTCPNLIDILYPYVLRLKNLSSNTLFKYAEILLETDRIQMAQRLAPRIADHILSLNRDDYYWIVYNRINLLIEISPSKALTVLKKTRSKGIHSWEDDDGERIAHAAAAYLKLNRPAQAARLFSLALKKGVYNETKEFCQTQLNELTENV